MSTLAQGTPNGPTKAGATRAIWRARLVANKSQYFPPFFGVPASLRELLERRYD
jgi:hypothetical protein